MTTFTAIPDTSLAQDKPFTQSIARATRDNPLALAEGDGTAPEMVGVSPFIRRVASNTAALVFNNLPDGHSILEFDFVGLCPMSPNWNNTLVMEISLNNGTTWLNSGYQQADDAGQTSLAYLLITSPSNIFNSNTANTINGSMRTYNFSSTSVFKQFESQTFWMSGTPQLTRRRIYGQFDQTAKITAVRFRFLTGNIAAGYINMRRVRAT